jgi:hypothetical protein
LKIRQKAEGRGATALGGFADLKHVAWQKEMREGGQGDGRRRDAEK